MNNKINVARILLLLTLAVGSTTTAYSQAAPVQTIRGQYTTRAGQKTERGLTQELAAAGYAGPWDIASMLTAYERAAPLNICVAQRRSLALVSSSTSTCEPLGSIADGLQIIDPQLLLDPNVYEACELTLPNGRSVSMVIMPQHVGLSDPTADYSYLLATCQRLHQLYTQAGGSPEGASYWSAADMP